MSVKLIKFARLSVLAFVAVFAVGCASTGALKEVRNTAEQAQRTANAAQQTANDALNAANSSQACCDATNDKIDRMFSRSMMK